MINFYLDKRRIYLFWIGAIDYLIIYIKGVGVGASFLHFGNFAVFITQNYN